MTHCIICGKRLWFENWRNVNKYAWNSVVDTQPWKPKVYLYKVSKDIILSHYSDRDKPRTQVIWYHIKCINEMGTPSNVSTIDE